MMWTLVICAGISWGGCGHNDWAPMPQADCFKALAAIRNIDAGGALATADDKRRSAIAYCRPTKAYDYPQK